MDYESIFKFQQKEHRKTTTGMLNQQSGCNGNVDRWERKIPLHIGDEHSTRQWPGQSHFVVADGDSWMDNLFLLEGNIFERPNDLATEFGGKWNRTTEQASDEEPKSKRQSLDLTDFGRRHQSGETRNVLRDDHSDNHVPFRKQYVDLMFSSLSIKGWDHDGTSCLPCHQIDLIKEPTLLTTTSFPFRIIFANDAFLRLRRDENVLGASFFECFVSDQLEMKAHLCRAVSFLSLLLDGAGCSIRMVVAEGSEVVSTIPCVVNAYPVVSNGIGGAEGTYYYAMCFSDIQHDEVEISRHAQQLKIYV